MALDSNKITPSCAGNSDTVFAITMQLKTSGYPVPAVSHSIVKSRSRTSRCVQFREQCLYHAWLLRESATPDVLPRNSKTSTANIKERSSGEASHLMKASSRYLRTASWVVPRQTRTKLLSGKESHVGAGSPAQAWAYSTPQEHAPRPPVTKPCLYDTV